MKIGLFDVIKAGVEIIVSIGTGVIVGGFTGKVVSKSKGIEKFCATIAAVAIEGVVASKASGYLNDQVDNIQRKIEGSNEEDEDDEEDEDYE